MPTWTGIDPAKLLELSYGASKYMKNLDLDQWKEELAQGVDSDGISPEKAAGVLGVGALEVMRLMENNELDHVHVFRDQNLTDELFVVIPNYSLKRYIHEHPPQEPAVAKKDELSLLEQDLMVSELGRGNPDFIDPHSSNRRMEPRSAVSTELENAMELKNADLGKNNTAYGRDETSGDQSDYMFTNIDPITGNDIEDITGHPFVQDGNVTIYFESEATKKAFTEMPLTQTHSLKDSYEEGTDRS